MRLVVPRPSEKWEETRRICADRGVEPILVPLLTIEPGASKELDTFMDAAFDDRADWIVFTGASGVQAVLDHAGEQGRDRALVTAMNRTRVAAIGSRTERALAGAGVDVAVVPDRTDSHGLLEVLVDEGVDGARIELPRSNQGTAVLREGLLDAGAASVHEFAAYTLGVTEDPSVLADAVRQLDDGSAAGILFTSALTSETFVNLAADQGFTTDDLDRVVVGALGGPTEKALAALGIEPDVVPDRADLGLLVDAVKEKAERGA